MAEERVTRAPWNGPYLPPGSLLLMDEEGNSTEGTRRTVAMRRCGSRSKPYCDGTHKTNGFGAAGAILQLR
jgi:CDGSH-type Zn-finger protein